MLRAFGLVAAIGASHFTAHAGDLLRGGARAGQQGVPSAAAQNAGAAEAARARANAQDILKRTNTALDSVRAMQQAARAAALAGPDNLGLNPNAPGQSLPNVPNGLQIGGLEVAPGVGVDPSLWRGATLPNQSASGGRTRVKIDQTESQAVLTWKTFNIGKKTIVEFDQNAGGAQKSQWIAFNKIQDPSGAPSQILGNIEAGGQVYVINQNGIIFGGSSQINTRSFTASSLPINDNLIQRGLLNNPDAQFLFSALSVPGGSDGTPNFTPPAPLTPNGQIGDVVVQKGAILSSPPSADGNGGRVMLVGANVHNDGTISTPAGQAVLAAGLQVGVTAHASNDPSLRGLDVWVGDVGNDAGTVTNAGLMESFTGSMRMVGRAVNQLGVLESSTSVSLNGRIDLAASYGAVGNPTFDNSGQRGFGGPAFLNQFTGVVEFGGGSSTRVLPDYENAATIPGTSLPERSQINIEGAVIHLAGGATMLAPNGKVNLRAGVWPYKDLDGNRTTSTAAGVPEADLGIYITAPAQRFSFSSGQVYLDGGSVISVAGTPDVSAPLDHSILTVQLRGGELADSPLQRTGQIRGVSLTIDLRQTGEYNGRYWMGTPLGDAVGLAGLIARNAAQLTVRGGDISIQTGGSIVTQSGSVLDVAGGYSTSAAGMVQTTRLRIGANLVDIADATPDRVYHGIYDGKTTRTFAKWGVSETFTSPLAPLGAYFEQSTITGASGGTLTLTAPSMALDGEMRGQTIQGPRQRSARADLSTLALNFRAERFESALSPPFLTVRPTPPEIVFDRNNTLSPADAFTAPGGVAPSLRKDRLTQVILSPEIFEESGFGHLAIDNADGGILVPADVTLTTPVLGSVTLSAARLKVDGAIVAPGGKINFTVHNISPTAISLLPSSTVEPLPLADPQRGIFLLSSGAKLSTAGLLVDDRRGVPERLEIPLVIDGGTISINSFSAKLEEGSIIDVSGGAVVNGLGRVTYGDGGSIAILTGKDPLLAGLIGGSLELGSTLLGYSGAQGGGLSIQAMLIQVGGGSAVSAGSPVLRFAASPTRLASMQALTPLVLDPSFFQTGGFTSYTLTGLGAASSTSPGAGGETIFPPAVQITPGTVLEPLAERWLAFPNIPGTGRMELRPILLPEGQRKPVSLTFKASSTDDAFTLDVLETRGDIVLGAGARIRTDAGASVTFEGSTIALLGGIEAPGGTISIRGDSRFPLTAVQASAATAALATVYLGPQAHLSTAGKTVMLPDAYDRRTGTIHPGGRIAISGNLVAEAGAVLDVSGTSATLDVHPSRIALTMETQVPLNSGINSTLYKLRTVPLRIDSNAGSIELTGSEMLFSDATLLGNAGGPTATGGTLSVFSGRFYEPNAALRTSADINLVVTQDGRTLPGTGLPRGIGLTVADAAGVVVPGMGYFTANTFINGGFDSLDLGGKFLENAIPLAYGGNVEFRGPVNIVARGTLRIAGGGVIQADDQVHLTAAYLAAGQPFRAPLNPADIFYAFTKTPGVPTDEFRLPPVFGPGSVNLQAALVDLGTLSLQNVGAMNVIADGGDIRGSGTISLAGDLRLSAAQIYPTTLANFSIFAYDHAGGQGSVTITRAGQGNAPLSAGGSLNIFASNILQRGVLLAPFGRITLGWDGTDLDPSDADLDQPIDITGGFRFDSVTQTNTTIAAPIANRVTLASGSVTSVAGINHLTGEELLVPFGLSPDGLSWVDPRGVNITVAGLPQKSVSIAGNNVVTEAGSTIDLRGGGDLLAYRWVAGNGGSIDRLATANQPWSAVATYQSGDLVIYQGQTWSARVRIDPDDFLDAQFPSAVPEPEVGRFWTRVAESYAVVPGYAAPFAPYAAFNTGTNAGSLAGDPGYTSGLRIGAQVTLDAGSGLPSGSYTLLPRRYALLPGAYLITPQSSGPLGSYAAEEGSIFTTGYRADRFNLASTDSAIRSLYEIASPEIIAGRVTYDLYSANSFMTEAAERLDIATVQRLPRDSGALVFQGTTTLDLRGRVLSKPVAEGRGARIDISSSADIQVLGAGQTAVGSVVLDSSLLSGFGAESLLIGGIRRDTENGTVIEVRSPSVTVNNAGSPLTGADITLVANGELTLAEGAQVVAAGTDDISSEVLYVSGPGTLLRVSVDPRAQIVRNVSTVSNLPKLTIGAGARVAGAAVALDSTNAFDLSPDAQIEGRALSFGAGQISIALAGVPSLTGQLINPHLVLAGGVLADVQQANALSLTSYQNSIDIYGAGDFGSPTMASLSLQAGAIRGFDQGAGAANFTAGQITLSNRNNIAAPAAIAAPNGTLVLNADNITVGVGALQISQYANVVLNAAGGLLLDGTGGLTVQQNLTANTPVLTTTRGATQNLLAGGALILNATSSPSTLVSDLGGQLTLRGAAVFASTDILLPSGGVQIRATTGAVQIDGRIDVGGRAQDFYDLTRYSDAGTIQLISDAGEVSLLGNSAVSVAAPAGGGNAGTIIVSAASGQFSALGSFEGQGGAGGRSGSFELDAASLASFATLTDLLNNGTFNESRNLRLRTGDITISGTTTVKNFILSTDAGSITVTGTIDASGATGGKIELIARNNVTLADGALLDVSGTDFSNAGKGGAVRLEAGAINASGAANLAGFVSVAAGSTIDLNVDAHVPGSINDSNSSAFRGQFTGVLQIRAPRVGTTVNVKPLQGTILNPSAVVVEGFRVYDRTANSGVVNAALRNTIHADNITFMTGEGAMRGNLLLGSIDPTGLGTALVITPGVEIINRTGNLILGVAGNANGTNPAEDWNLATYRYGAEGSAGILTMRAAGNLVFQNALSDGFAGLTAEQGAQPVGRQLWLANLMDINPDLPVNAQSWSYRLTAGAEFGAADFREVRSLDTLAADTGSLLLGNFYAAALPGVSGAAAETANAISPGAGTTTRFQVIRTGTGNIEIAAARDVQLRNQFATIYSAGVRLTDPTQIYAPGDFSIPVIERSIAFHPDQTALGAIQQIYPAQWSMAGGNIQISAGADIRRVTRISGNTVTDTSRQIPTNWLYRRGYVDPTTGTFGVGGVDDGIASVTDPSASTTWWIDYSNFFQGIGALGGGDISLNAGRNIINADAVIPTTARMPGLDGADRIAPDASKLHEVGGGDLVVKAGRNIDGGIYYLERGNGELFAGNEVTTNASRTPSLGIITTTPQIRDSLNWLPTTLFLGKGNVSVSARGDVLLGPVANTFLLPQGVGNKYWYKTYFNTYDADSAVNVASFGGSVTHRLSTVLPGTSNSRNILQAWIETQNFFSTTNVTTRGSSTQPWIRVGETSITPFATTLSVAPPTLRSTAFSGDLNIVGALNLFPSATGQLELAASGGVIGLNPAGRTASGFPRTILAWTTAEVNLSDADPAAAPGTASPLAYQSIVGRSADALIATRPGFLSPVDILFNETGSFTGAAATVEVRQALHAAGLLHANDAEPIRIYGVGGDITGLTLYSAKFAQIAAERDVSDVSFYIQNVNPEDVSFVSAGRDIIPYNENTALRSRASDLAQGNAILDPLNSTVLTTAAGTAVQTRVLAGDIQINGPGILEVLAGRNLDLGSGPNFADGTGVGITSIGSARNPFLPLDGAGLITIAGIGGRDGGPALGLAGSEFAFEEFSTVSLPDGTSLESPYLESLQISGGTFTTLTEEQKAIVALEILFAELREAGEAAATSGNYDAGFAAISKLFGASRSAGEIFTQARDIRTTANGFITAMAPGGGLTMASDIFGNPLTPPGIVTEFGGAISILTESNVEIGQARIFTLRGGDLTIWSSGGDIAAGTASKTVVTAPPTRVVIDATSATVQTDLGGLATGGGIGVLAAVAGIAPGSVFLLAPEGVVDAGDAGIRATGDITIAAVQVLNADNIAAAGTAVGVPTAPVVSAPNISGLTAASNAAGAAASATNQVANQNQESAQPEEEEPSIITVEVVGYGGGEG